MAEQTPPPSPLPENTILRVPRDTGERVIKVGRHAEEAFKFNKLDVDDAAALQTQKYAMAVCQNLVDPSRPGNSQSLIFGMIQSGKTHALCQSLAIAADNGFRLFIVLSSDNNTLYNQTAKRLRQALPMMRFVMKEQLKPDGREQTVQSIQDALKEGGRCAVIFCSKNRRVLDKVRTTLQLAGAGRIPTVIFDDEGDQASLNARASQTTTAAGKALRADLTAVNRAITELRDFLTTYSYVAVTATPQALFLQGRENAFRPGHHVVLQPGTDYQGSEHFLKEHAQEYWRAVPDKEVVDYENLDAAVRPNLPEGMKDAVASFLVASALRLINDERFGKDRGKYSMLMHVTMRQAEHRKLCRSVQDYLSDLEKRLPQKVPPEIHSAYRDLSETVLKGGDVVGSIDEVVGKIVDFGLSGQVREVNFTTTRMFDFTDPDNYSYCNIFIGGNVLGRGMTIRGLITTYYGRASNRPQIDTVIQHARWYGYRMKLAPYIRLYMAKPIWERFTQLHYHDMELRLAVFRYLDNRTPIIPLFVPGQMDPTRGNVIEPGSIGAYPGGSATFSRVPDVRTAIRNTPAIDAFMKKKFEGKRPSSKADRLQTIITAKEAKQLLGFVPESREGPVGTWDTVRIQKSLEVVCRQVEAVDKVRLVWGEGMTRSRGGPDSPYAGVLVSFFEGDEKGSYHDTPEPQVPTLFMYKISGKSHQVEGGKPTGPGWGDGEFGKGDAPPAKPKDTADFYVPGIAWPELIRDQGYAICFTLD